MKYTTAILFSAAAVYAQSDAGDTNPVDSLSDTYISAVCTPTNDTGFPDWNAPCNAAQAIQVQCMYGESYFQQILSQYSAGSSLIKRQSSDSGDDQDAPVQPNSTQRSCICQSQFWDQANGCVDCYKAHGASEADSGLTNDNLASLSSQYCAASTTPTLGLADWFSQYAQGPASTSAPAASSSFSDPIGNKTDVSLYFTPSVTGSAAYIVAQATGSATSEAPSVYGQTRATASANTGTTSGRASQTSSGGAAGRTEAAAVAGLFGVAGLVALL